MKLILALLLMIGFVGCSSMKPGCLIQDKLSAVATDVVVSKLQCKNAFAVKADMDELVKNIGLCKTGPIADSLCPMVADQVVDKLTSAVLPAEWMCSAADAKDLVKGALLSACKQIPVSQWKPD